MKLMKNENKSISFISGYSSGKTAGYLLSLLELIASEKNESKTVITADKK